MMLVAGRGSRLRRSSQVSLLFAERPEGGVRGCHNSQRGDSVIAAAQSSRQLAREVVHPIPHATRRPPLHECSRGDGSRRDLSRPS